MAGFTNGMQQPGGNQTAAAMSDERLSNAQHQPQNTAEPKPNGSVTFHKAVKRDAKLRFAICGPSGSGKTYTLLNLATELGGPVALVDTEHGSASKYADLFDFDVLELDSYDPLTTNRDHRLRRSSSLPRFVHRLAVALLDRQRWRVG